ncbi:dTDP-4-dehydrorhamnose reductase [Mariprofundus micogutta]|uniref:dTDP-4-dehydrorhamnose reductase n=1 Tax=Mariprofundus micogutta TaxID=1921010 RepID=A0A1L8CLG6_9PROT|nr:SDR family oxidoreductase [Mariprofundus micogutta]GAV19752.1 dTDP-4-dehydrorhamnose reductase [Mariprofundus micogutta]
MKILILGGDGMLGHQLLKSWSDRHEVCVTLRGESRSYDHYGLFHDTNSFYGVDVRDFNTIEQTVSKFQPDAIVNAVGIVKQRAEAQDAIISLEVNSLLPHRLSQLCGEVGARLIHMSTDCVFSGLKGMYTENDLEDASDLYGRSKLLGEVHDVQAVTLRTSIIGLELARNKSLIEWFLAQSGQVNGFSRAIYSGFTTMEMARIIENVLLEHKALSGLWHVASDPINKFELLSKLSEFMGRADIRLLEDANFCCERSLDASKFNKETGYRPPSWDEMLSEQAVQIRERSE